MQRKSISEINDILRELVREPKFLLGMAVKLLFVLSAWPRLHSDAVVPFLSYTLTHISADPWSTFIELGGSATAFPYGIVTYLVYAPGVLLGLGLDAAFGMGDVVCALGVRFTSLVCDLLSLLILLSLRRDRLSQILNFYWLSPLLLYACYWHGSLAIASVALLLAALFAFYRRYPALAGVLLAVATSAEWGALLITPFVLLFVWKNPRLRRYRRVFLVVFALSIMFTFVIWLSSASYIQMVLRTQHYPMLNLFYSKTGIDLYIVPIVLLLVMFYLWRLTRISIEMLYAVLGTSFCIAAILNPHLCGWLVWLVPFLCLYQLDRGFVGQALTWSYTLVVLVFGVGLVSTTAVPLLGLADYVPPLSLYILGTTSVETLLGTMLAALGLVLCLDIFLWGLGQNDRFRLRQRMVAIGIAGVDAVGKDTLARALAGVFGRHCTSHISGEDYRHWDRHTPLWDAPSLLNPRTKNLRRFAHDIVSLIDGEPTLCRRYHDAPKSFTRSRGTRQDELVIVTGLYALYWPQVRDRLDVAIYLGMDEELRQALSRKRRDEQDLLADVDQSIASGRLPDGSEYVVPQRDLADIIFTLLPENSRDLERCIVESRYRLKVHLRDGFAYEEICRNLIGLCGLNVDVELRGEAGSVEMLIEGLITGSGVRDSLRSHLDELGQFMSLRPLWQAGMLGVMQYISLAQLAHALKRRELGYDLQ